MTSQQMLNRMDDILGGIPDPDLQFELKQRHLQLSKFHPSIESTISTAKSLSELLTASAVSLQYGEHSQALQQQYSAKHAIKINIGFPLVSTTEVASASAVGTYVLSLLRDGQHEKALGVAQSMLADEQSPSYHRRITALSLVGLCYQHMAQIHQTDVDEYARLDHQHQQGTDLETSTSTIAPKKKFVLKTVSISKNASSSSGNTTGTGMAIEDDQQVVSKKRATQEAQLVHEEDSLNEVPPSAASRRPQVQDNKHVSPLFYNLLGYVALTSSPTPKMPPETVADEHVHRIIHQLLSPELLRELNTAPIRPSVIQNKAAQQQQADPPKLLLSNMDQPIEQLSSSNIVKTWLMAFVHFIAALGHAVAIPAGNSSNDSTANRATSIRAANGIYIVDAYAHLNSLFSQLLSTFPPSARQGLVLHAYHQVIQHQALTVLASIVPGFSTPTQLPASLQPPASPSQHSLKDLFQSQIPGPILGQSSSFSTDIKQLLPQAPVIESAIQVTPYGPRIVGSGLTLLSSSLPHLSDTLKHAEQLIDGISATESIDSPRSVPAHQALKGVVIAPALIALARAYGGLNPVNAEGLARAAVGYLEKAPQTTYGMFYSTSFDRFFATRARLACYGAMCESIVV